jgi:threonine/homoserine/homoserine lactone efflux protein
MLPVVFPDSTSLWLFGLAALALLAIPGPAVLYIVVQSADQGRRVGPASVAGVHLGTLVHVAAASAGPSAVIVASSVAFSAVKYASAAYLVYLGVRIVGLGLVTDSLYALAAGTVAGLLRRQRNAVRYGSGIVFIALGATAALAKRT